LTTYTRLDIAFAAG